MKLDAVRTVVSNWFTEADNKTFCIIKALAAAVSSSGLYLQIHDVVVLHNHFDFQQFGVGAGALFAAIGAALGMKKDTPP